MTTLDLHKHENQDAKSEDESDKFTTEEKKKMLEESYRENYRIYDRLAEL